jgi:hypothetical protein
LTSRVSIDDSTSDNDSTNCTNTINYLTAIEKPNRLRKQQQEDTSEEQLYALQKELTVKPEDIATISQNINLLRARWLERYADIMVPVPLEMPPFRDVNHSISLIDDKKIYNYHLPRCPDVLKPELREKINRYVKAGWWEMKAVPQAAPLLCIYKKSGKLHTVVDARKRNDNTIKDVTPFPDQDQICQEVARAKYQTKLDMSDAYEQIPVAPEDVWKTAFATIYGTFVSNVMQMGDCNAPSTFQSLMTQIFRAHLGEFVHCYLDDIFIFSNSIEDHERHIEYVFSTLRKSHLFLSKEKCDMYSTKMDCLGHVVDDKGLHADSDKMERVREW